MKILVTALASAMLAALPMLYGSPVSAQPVAATTVTTTTRTYQAYSYGSGAYRPRHHHRAFVRSAASYGEDAGFEGPIGVPVYANGDVYIDCPCQRR